MKKFYIHTFDDYQIIQTPNLWKTHQNYNYILAKDKNAIIFDPGELEPLSLTIKENNLNISGIYLTHHHQDHVGATIELAKKWQCPVFGFIKDKHRLPAVTHYFEEHSNLKILDLNADILFLPGHTLGLCAFYFKNKNWLFSNDLIFSFGCGRVFEGTYEQMFNSLKQVSLLPEETILFSSHEYTLANINFAKSILKDDIRLNQIEKKTKDNLINNVPSVPMTLGFELQNNPFLRWHDPVLRDYLGLHLASDLEVFTQIRKLKDQFK